MINMGSKPSPEKQIEGAMQMRLLVQMMVVPVARLKSYFLQPIFRKK